MLKSVTRKSQQGQGLRFAIVASQYNAHFVEAMLEAACEELKLAGVDQIQVVRVPGAYEIPVIASRLARGAAHVNGTAKHDSLAAIICLGVILRGQTVHAAHIGEAVSHALMEIQVRDEIPVIHEVLLLEDEEQARARCLSKTHNRGAEAAQTALAMAQVLRELGKG
jgi:6,7-dimethyl-8-ribityllumazine synthase